MGSPLSGLRLEREDFEKRNLSPYAMKSAESRGRKKGLEACDLRTDFQRDRDRITHSKAFRRLMHKTQVFISPDGDHYRTRLTHTLEVAQIARTMARALKLNEDLTEAIALGHDIGHTPFGHTGEEAFADILPGFCHNEQSVRVCEVIERDGEGLNLTYEVLDGILNHRGSGTPGTLEGKVVQISDKIAYINHDIDDAIRAGQLNEDDLPADCTDILGKNNHDRIDFLIRDVITVSMNKPDIVMTEYVKNAMYDLRQYMYDTVYTSQLQMKERKKISGLLKELHRYYADEADSLPDEFKKLIERGESCSRVALDYVACMTDRFALSQYTNIFMPANWR